MPKPAGSAQKVSATNDKSYPEHYIQTLCVLPGEAQGMKGFVECFVIKSKIQEEKKDPFLLSSQQNMVWIEEKHAFFSDEICLLS